MKMKVRLVILGMLISVVFYPFEAQAMLSTNAIDFTLAVGPQWMGTQTNRSIIISPYETDSVQVLNSSTTALWNIGIANHAFIQSETPRQYFNRLGVEVNVYATSGLMRGDVWQYQLPQFNNYTFRAPYQSTRFMLDFKPNLFDHPYASLFGILGIGVALNNLAYYEQITGAGITPNSNLWIPRRLRTNLGYDVGLGLNKKASERFDIFLEYLYAYLGKTTTSPIEEKNNVNYTSAPNFILTDQSLLFGVHWHL